MEWLRLPRRFLRTGKLERKFAIRQPRMVCPLSRCTSTRSWVFSFADGRWRSEWGSRFVRSAVREDGQPDEESCTTALGALEPDSAAVRFDDALGDRKA